MRCKLSPLASSLLQLTQIARHQVLVEKWVTSAELDELQRCKLLGWQSDDEEPEQVDQIRMQDVGEKKEDPNSDLVSDIC